MKTYIQIYGIGRDLVVFMEISTQLKCVFVSVLEKSEFESVAKETSGQAISPSPTEATTLRSICTAI